MKTAKSLCPAMTALLVVSAHPTTRHKERNMKFGTLKCIAAMALLVVLAIPVSLAAQQIITIDAQGAGTGSGQGTVPQQIIP